METKREQVQVLDAATCWDLLARAEIARLVVSVGSSPDVFPVNHLVDGRTIVLRTTAGTKLAAAVLGGVVALEVDGIEPGGAEAWSVVVKGRAAEIERLTDYLAALDLPLYPWVEPADPRLVRITPYEVTGRRVIAGPRRLAARPHTGPVVVAGRRRLRRVLVGVDGPAATSPALRWAAGVASGLDAHVVAAHVQPPPAPEVPWAATHAAALARLDGWCAPLRGPGCSIEGHVPDGEVTEALLAEPDIDLIVVGGSDDGAVEALVDPGVAQLIVRRSNVPVAVVPRHGGGVPRRLLVGWDGSPSAAEAGRLALDVGGRLGAEVSFVHVREGWAPPRWSDEALEARLHELVAAAGRPDLVLTYVAADDVRTGMARSVHRSGADLVVLGMDPLGPARPVRFGGTTSQLLTGATVATLVVPAPS